jgi:hypothetical protein
MYFGFGLITTLKLISIFAEILFAISAILNPSLFSLTDSCAVKKDSGV